MIKTIKIEDKEIRLDNNIGWTIEYRSQFNTDILPTLMPMIAGIMDTLAGLVSSTGKTSDLDIDDLIKIIRSEEMFEALVKLSSFEFVDLMNITWAMAKTADEDIPEPKKWVKEIGSFPIDEIGPALFEMIFKGVVSSKNWERLQKTLTDLKPKQVNEKKSQ